MMLVSVANTPDIIKGPVNLEAQTVAVTTTEQNIDITNATSSADIKKITREFFKDKPLLAEIARCESHYRQYVSDGVLLRGKVNPADVGVMQINEKYHLQRSKELGFDIYTLKGNLEYGEYLYDEQGAQPWSASRPCWGPKADQALAVNVSVK